MKVDLDTLRGFFNSAPFMADLGVEVTAVSEGRVAWPVMLGLLVAIGFV